MKTVKVQYPYLLVYPFPTVLVSSVDSRGKYNCLAVSWQTPLSFDPPLIGVSIGYKRYSYHLIHHSGEFVINVMPIDKAKVVLRAGEISGKNVDKFKVLGLTVEQGKSVKAPVIQEAIAAIECMVEEEVAVGDHALFIGRVVATHINPEYYDRSGKPYLKKIKPLLYGGKNQFCTIDPSSIVDLS